MILKDSLSKDLLFLQLLSKKRLEYEMSYKKNGFFSNGVLETAGMSALKDFAENEVQRPLAAMCGQLHKLSKLSKNPMVMKGTDIADGLYTRIKDIINRPALNAAVDKTQDVDNNPKQGFRL